MKYFNRTFTSFIIITILGIGNWGCDSLEETPSSFSTDQSFNYSEANYKSVIGGVYSQIRTKSGTFSDSGFLMAQETSGDATVITANQAGGWDDNGKFRRMNQHNWNAEQAHVLTMWDTFYSGALEANRVLDKIEQGILSIPSSVGYAAIRAEMRVARAWYYWYILDNYGSAPLVTAPPSKVDQLPSKSSRTDLYNFVVTEITEALPNLSEENNPNMYGRFNKWAAKALLANVYLNAEIYAGQSEWENVITQTNEIINSGRYSLDDNYRGPFMEQNQNSREIIFAIPFDEIHAPGFLLHLYTLASTMRDKYLMQATPWGTGGLKGIPQHMDIYKDEDNRLEDNWIMGPQFAPNGDPIEGVADMSGQQLVFENKMENGIAVSVGEGYRVGKFEFYEGATGSGLNNDFPIFRYAEVLMMKAEALLRTNRPNEAAQIVTRVRQRSFDDPSEATITGSELQMDSQYPYGYVEDYQIVDPGNQDPIQYGRFLDELSKEFLLEGHRRRDMIRFGVFVKKSWLSKRPNGDHRTIFPIPQDVVDTNTNMEQHPEYQ